jgi:glutamyl-tRNA synthetase
MTDLVRFAPSPTGLLHVGNARTALLNALFARQRHGTFLLRFDDTDVERSRQEYAEAIMGDLAWLGIGWDRIERQSLRLDAYRAALDRLRAEGRVYRCYETAEELEFKRKRQLARGQPPTYDRSALALTEDDCQQLETEGRRPYWRLRLPDATIAWEDLVRGRVELTTGSLSDPILARADGSFLYMLPSTVDDIEFGITHVIRGEDHVTNTAVQIVLAHALGATPPVYAHVPLLTDKAGRGLSKRLGSLTVASLRDEGIEPMPLNALLARLGTGAALDARLSLEELAQDFDLTRLARATPKFDRDQLDRLNERYLQGLSFADVAPRLQALHLDRAGEAFWLAVRPNIHRFDQVRAWYDVCFGAITPEIADPVFTTQAARLLPEEPWTDETWNTWTKALQVATGRRGKELFRPLRLALTGAADGPELRLLLPLIGRKTAEQRLLAGPKQPSAALRTPAPNPSDPP